MGRFDLQHSTVDSAQLADQAGVGQELNSTAKQAQRRKNKPVGRYTRGGTLQDRVALKSEKSKVVLKDNANQSGESKLSTWEFEFFHTFSDPSGRQDPVFTEGLERASR